MKLCVFQGTFDPIHKVHMAMANYINSIYDFDTILFIPAYKQPHKEINDELANHRLKMVKIAIEGETTYGISNLEFQNEKFAYAYNAVLELYKRYNVEGKISFIIGSDEFRELSDWYETNKLKRLVNFIVFNRKMETDRERMVLMRSKGYDFSQAKMGFINLSSSMIRERIQQGKSISGLVPPKVQEYIKENELYKNE